MGCPFKENVPTMTCSSFGNILHGSVVDASDLGNSSLLLTTGQIVDVAMSCVLLWSGALS
jgi:hypothetical protein